MQNEQAQCRVQNLAAQLFHGVLRRSIKRHYINSLSAMPAAYVGAAGDANIAMLHGKDTRSSCGHRCAFRNRRSIPSGRCSDAGGKGRRAAYSRSASIAADQRAIDLHSLEMTENSLPTTAPDDQEIKHAMAALQTGNVKDAERIFKAVLAKQPNHLAALNLLSIVLIRFRRFAEAET